MKESAFPYAYFDKQLNQTRTMYGMNLRDYFAAMALQGWLASFSEEMEPHPRKTAEFCYVIADAMMDARDE